MVFIYRAPLQFGDDVGYNEEVERAYIEKQMGMEYFLTPISREYILLTVVISSLNETHGCFKKLVWMT